MPQETKNRVLLVLPDKERRRVVGMCTRVDLKRRTILERTGESAKVLHFPETAVISTVAAFADGSNIEMANIGREACTGLGLILGQPRRLNTNEVQIDGTALVMPAEVMTELKTSLPAFETALFSTVQAVFYQVLVSGACNGKHLTRQRLARWLLTMRDRNDRDIMKLTHDFLAEMLGVRRATITELMQGLQAEGLIETSRGEVRITDRAGLRQASCECYDLVRNAYDALLPEPKTAN